MMKEEEVIDIFKGFGVKNPEIIFTNNYARYAAYYSNGKFEISRIALKYNSQEGIRYIVGHEVAHIKHFNHGVSFQHTVNAMGINEDDVIKVSRYISFCPRCKETCRLNTIKKGYIYTCKLCKKKGIRQEVMIYKHQKI